MDARIETFHDEAERRLSPVLCERGFSVHYIRPGAHDYPQVLGVRYRRGQVTIESLFVREYMNEDFVATMLHTVDDANSGHNAQLATYSAHTIEEMRLALDSQRTAVRDLVETLGRRT